MSLLEVINWKAAVLQLQKFQGWNNTSVLLIAQGIFPINQCTTIKFVLGGRFKESELFSGKRVRAPNDRITEKLTVMKMQDHFQTEDNKEVEGSPAENLKCLYFRDGYFAPHEVFFKFFVIFWYQS